MLYRLDYEATGEAVPAIMGGGDLITRHMQTARRRAVAEAIRSDAPILISRITNNGTVRPCLVIEPDGRARRPASTKAPSEREDCKRGTGRPCFCTACRAERRASR